MPEIAEGYKPPVTRIEPLTPKETLKGKHFSYTLVFGQGPVQESGQKEKVELGRKGLNFYSRLESLAAGEMLKKGITDKLILSGGQTGANARTEIGQSEAVLMMDLIKRHVAVDDDGYFYNNRGDKVKFSDAVLIENIAPDSLRNFLEIINKYIDKEGLESSKMAILGSAFHALPTKSLGVGQADIGRLEALSKIYQLDAPVYSAEEAIKELAINTHNEDTAISGILTRLTNLSQTDEVTKQKSRQEDYLVKMIKEGDWLRVMDSFGEQRIRRILLAQPDTVKAMGLTGEQIEKEEIGVIKSRMQELYKKIHPSHEDEYQEIKKDVFSKLEAMGTVDEKGRKIPDEQLAEEAKTKDQIFRIRRNILGYYGKGDVKK